MTATMLSSDAEFPFPTPIFVGFSLTDSQMRLLVHCQLDAETIRQGYGDDCWAFNREMERRNDRALLIRYRIPACNDATPVVRYLYPVKVAPKWLGLGCVTPANSMEVEESEYKRIREIVGYSRAFDDLKTEIIRWPSYAHRVFRALYVVFLTDYGSSTIMDSATDGRCAA